MQRERLAHADALMGRLLRPWWGVMLGLFCLRLWAALTQHSDAAIPWTSLGHLLMHDAWVLLAGLPIWLLLSAPLLWVSTQRLQQALLILLASVVLVAEALLSHYFALAGVALGADLWAYSLGEIWTTVSAASGALLGSWLIPLPWGILCIAASVYRPAGRPTLSAPPGWATLLLGIGLISTPLTPASWLKDLPLAERNKLAWLVTDSVQHASPGPKPSIPVQARDPQHPFARPESTPDTLSALLNLPPETPPHLLFLVVEGLGRNFSGPNARLGSFTPFLDELAQRSLYWENFVATQGRTFAVLPSLLGSLPLGLHAEKPRTHDSLLSILKANGYALRYFTGTNLNFDHQGDYLRSEGVAFQFSERDFPESKRKLTEWGYADGDLLEQVSTQARQASSQPTLTVVQTMSMHSPFTVPEQNAYRQAVVARLDTLNIPANQRAPYMRQQDIYASILYTDDMLRRFFQQMATTPGWDNTLVVITGDHRLPEIPMATQLERYHVPLIIASPRVKEPRRVRAVSSHVDVAPALLAMLSHRYGIRTPATVSWMGTGLDVSTQFRNLHAVALQQTKTDLSDYLSGLYFLSHDRLFRVSEGLYPEPVDDVTQLERVRNEFQAFLAAREVMLQNPRLTPAMNADQRIRYDEATRTLETQGRTIEPSGVVVSEMVTHLSNDGTLEAHATLTNASRQPSVVFVPLLVVTDTDGRQLGEAYGKAMSLAPGQTVKSSLTLQPAAGRWEPGRHFAALVVSHPDTGRPVGQGQYHVAIKP